MAKKRVLVACGTGIATSTVVTIKIQEALKVNHVDAEVVQCKVAELPMKIDGADLIVTTTAYENSKVPVIRGLSFLTGIGMEKDLQKIVDMLKS
ncbi:MAG: PTS sugar transporter subunit IIB [Treponema sp.]|jgi:PTS system galactitol-specific IIB component|nr:PTS sugar transporter subunit IIB [Treponema sp.]